MSKASPAAHPAAHSTAQSAAQSAAHPGPNRTDPRHRSGFGATYLHEPDLFPARLAGEARGERDVFLELPGGTIQVCGVDASLHDCLAEAIPSPDAPDSGGGASTGDQPEIPQLLVFNAPSEEFRHFDLAGWELDFDLDYQASLIRAAGYECQFLIQLAPQLRAACFSGNPDPEWTYGMVHNLLRKMVAYRLLHQQGLLIHSAVVSDGQQAWLAYGRSGQGKTTLSRAALQQGLVVLSDDMNAVVRQDGQWLALATPFCGDLDASLRHRHSVPLVGLLRLQKGDSNQLTPLSLARTMASLSACAPYLNADPFRGQALLAAIEGLASEVPSFELVRTRDGSLHDMLFANPPPNPSANPVSRTAHV